MSNTKNINRPITSIEIRSIINSSDEDAISYILNTEATCNEVIQAVEWLELDDYMGVTYGEVIISRVSQVYRILKRL